MCIDFEKAFDSISFNFIKKTLKFFNFGDDLIKWVGLLLKDFTAVINHCGNISDRFNISRGCRQGCPLSPYLFLMAVEILAIKLRQDPKVEGFKSKEHVHLLELYADDISIFLKANDNMAENENNLRSTLSSIENFFQISCLRINLSKTTAIWFGVKHNCTIKLCGDLGIEWDTTFRLLGIDFHNNLENMEKNFDVIVGKVETVLNSWIYRHLTPFGKITVIKSLALSLSLIHI